MMQLPDSIGRIGRQALLAVGTVLVTATGSAAAQRGPGGYDGWMHDGWGMWGGWGFLWMLIPVVLVILLVYAVRNSGRSRADERTDRAFAELRERYARGELSDEEFERRRRTLQETE